MNHEGVKHKVYRDGSEEWRLNGILHREDGPAVIFRDGTKAWYLNGKLHREDGPAVIWPSGNKEWYLNGKKVTEQEHRARTFKDIEELFEL